MSLNILLRAGSLAQVASKEQLPQDTARSELSLVSTATRSAPDTNVSMKRSDTDRFPFKRLLDPLPRLPPSGAHVPVITFSSVTH